eukprot:TRINITY_DN7863_c3_g1_i1.p1 TRINITY_DN7863_c3_g1~~TRINITY_DN7863_c3_g1_i1.p1  ORF type:complete len:468 (-),score=70.44 TRINITY_DN7863_c3_g1_i1:200-1570(-)
MANSYGNVALIVLLLVSYIKSIQAGDGAVADACDFQPAGSRADLKRLDLCVSSLLGAFGLSSEQREGEDMSITQTCIGGIKGLGSQVAYINISRQVCWATPGMNMTARACEVLSSVAWEFMVLIVRHLAYCGVTAADESLDAMEALSDETFEVAGRLLQMEINRHADSPIGLLAGVELQKLHRDFTQPLQPEGRTRQLVGRFFSLCQKISSHVNWMIYRDTHFSWLADSSAEGKVVHTAWGGRDRWEELGAHDADSLQPLVGGAARAPSYAFVNEGSQRRDILVNLLKKLYAAQGEVGQLNVVEIGVFRAGLSEHLLEKLPFIRLIGVDPYIGKDGTFPGDFSETLDPDAALGQANSIFQKFGERADLLVATSEEAVKHIPDNSIDAVFVDGCHLYECVDSDLKAWLPKLRGPGSLVAGHDFSPQWPGVVRAVHEHRLDSQPVSLGMDWMFWWYLE